MVKQESTHGSVSSKQPSWWKRHFGRTGFEWLQLGIAALIPFAIWWFTQQQTTQQQDIENQRAQNETLQAYLDQMSHLILEKNLSDSENGSPVRVLARARTMAVLESLDDPQRKRTVIRFLNESELIRKEDPVVSLAAADLTEIELYYAEGGQSVNLPNTNLEGAYLRGSELTGVGFDGANLRDTALEGARLWGASLVDADLTQAQLGSTTDMYSLGGRLEEFPAADLSGANLRGATLTNAYMPEVDMSPLEGNTTSPTLPTDEGRTDLSGADLPYAHLVGADLRGTILEDADFTCATLKDADLTGATGITQKQLENQARSLSGATMPDGTKYAQQPDLLRYCPADIPEEFFQ